MSVKDSSIFDALFHEGSNLFYFVPMVPASSTSCIELEPVSKIEYEQGRGHGCEDDDLDEKVRVPAEREEPVDGAEEVRPFQRARGDFLAPVILDEQENSQSKQDIAPQLALAKIHHCMAIQPVVKISFEDEVPADPAMVDAGMLERAGVEGVDGRVLREDARQGKKVWDCGKSKHGEEHGVHHVVGY